jgi:hypothetical protein
MHTVLSSYKRAFFAQSTMPTLLEHLPRLLGIETIQLSDGRRDLLLTSGASIEDGAIGRSANNVLITRQRGSSASPQNKTYLVKGALATLTLSPQARKIDLQFRGCDDL